MSFTQQRFIIPFLSPILFLSIYGRKKKSHTLRSFPPLPKNGRQWLFFVNVFCIFFLFLYILGRFIISFWLLSLSLFSYHSAFFHRLKTHTTNWIISFIKTKILFSLSLSIYFQLIFFATLFNIEPV